MFILIAIVGAFVIWALVAQNLWNSGDPPGDDAFMPPSPPAADPVEPPATPQADPTGDASRGQSAVLGDGSAVNGSTQAPGKGERP
ncbi:hypothetical protein [Brevundimonas lutea]|uniref:hypothetical protein n=1 Tax=Brevundimonas lutea TaxID=2293980 RepID=UPI000F0408B9|nr:hypothetical protein [Brevundimonas lutea]